jgi:hypothetical protein
VATEPLVGRFATDAEVASGDSDGGLEISDLKHKGLADLRHGIHFPGHRRPPFGGPGCPKSVTYVSSPCVTHVVALLKPLSRKGRGEKNGVSNWGKIGRRLGERTICICRSRRAAGMFGFGSARALSRFNLPENGESVPERFF